MENQELWQVMNEAWSTLTACFEPELDRACKQRDLEPRLLMLLLAVFTFEPEDTTPGHLMVRGPYTSSEVYLRRLNEAAQLGYLENVDTSKFRLTDKGRNTTIELIQLAREAMVRADPLGNLESTEIVHLIGRLVQSNLDTEPPPRRWSIRLSFKLMPDIDPPMPHIEQAFSCLAAYRDDSHLAAWQNSGLSATSLEALTLFWRGEVSSLHELSNRLVSRGHPLRVYQDSLSGLFKLGYLAGTDESAWVTGAGRVFRNKIESDTDQYFYAPWTCLDRTQKQSLNHLLVKLRDGLNARVVQE
ncbi:MAG TPA: hypothetical protein VJL34_14680 [Anaerolineales bacterium]|nr:hypothetical protein [Anaerolineales bacterium]